MSSKSKSKKSEGTSSKSKSSRSQSKLNIDERIVNLIRRVQGYDSIFSDSLLDRLLSMKYPNKGGHVLSTSNPEVAATIIQAIGEMYTDTMEQSLTFLGSRLNPQEVLDSVKGFRLSKTQLEDYSDLIDEDLLSKIQSLQYIEDEAPVLTDDRTDVADAIELYIKYKYHQRLEATIAIFADCKTAEDIIFRTPSLSFQQDQVNGEIYRANLPKDGIKGYYKCGKCGGDEVTVSVMQVGGGDEGSTTFISCVSCPNNWRQRS